MQNDRDEYTLAEKPSVIYTILSYVASFSLFGLLIISVFLELKWGYFVAVLVFGPATMLFSRMAKKLNGSCPHCGVTLSGVPKNNGLTCPACKTRIVIREGKFWKVSENTDVSDGYPIPPPGMTLEQFALKKEKLKRRAIITFVLMGLSLTLFFLWLTWVYGWFIPYETKELEELQIARGTYHIHKYYRSRTPDYETGLKDAVSGRWILTANDAFCNIENYRQLFEGREAIVWHAPGPGGGKQPIVYQLEVDGRVICTVNKTNDRISLANTRKRFVPLITAGVLLVMWLGAAMAAYYGTYRKGLNGLFGQEK